MGPTSTPRPPTIWMNVTTSSTWTRPAVGIVRVEKALSAQLQTLFGPDRFKLCVWRDDVFTEWAPEMVQSAGSPLGHAVDVILPRTTSFDLARPYLLRALRRFSAPSADPSPAEPMRLSIPATSPANLHPKRGDIVISVGLDWEYPYADRFYGLAKKDGLRIITCCYDLIPVLFPHFCVGDVAKRFTEYFLQLCWGSEAVLCISQQTERDFVQLCHDLGAPPRRTLVIPLGDNIPHSDSEISDVVRSASSQPFILFVSTIERRKNHEVLYRAYHMLARRGHAAKLPRLVFVGMPGWGTGDLMKDIELDPFTRGLIVQLHHTSDGELNHLYRHAEFCVYPSLYEGWGLPVGEALAMGKAVMASSEGSLPEVGGDLVRYVQAWDVPGWANAMWEWIENPQLIRAAERKVRQQYKPRQWLGTARAVKQLIDDLPNPPTSAALRISPGYDMSTWAGIHLGPSILTNSEEGGLLVFGPHWAVNAGSYEVRVEGDVPAGESCAEAVWEVVSNSGSVIHHTERVSMVRSSGKGMAARFRVNLLQDTFDFELRCVLEPGSVLRVDSVELLPLMSESGRHPSKFVGIA